jgi:hypothetical protein
VARFDSDIGSPSARRNDGSGELVAALFDHRRNIGGVVPDSSVKLLLRKASALPEESVPRLVRHPLFAWLGVRPVRGQHTSNEHRALKKWAAGKTRLVEIGVAEGASAVGLREAMAPDGILWLIDPFHLSRVRHLNTMRRAAHRVVAKCQNGEVIWIEKFSYAAASDWSGQIDFLFIDGDHSENGVRRDWDDWHRFVATGGIVVFHDAALFPRSWTARDWGPVKLVDALFRNRAIPGWRIVDQVDSIVVIERFDAESA